MNDILALVGGAIGFVSFIGLCFVYLRGSADKGTIESQKRLIETRGTEIEDLTRRVDVAEGKVAAAETKVAAVEAENNILRRAVAHVEEIVALQQSVIELRDAQDRNHSEQVAVLGRILVALEEIAA